MFEKVQAGGNNSVFLKIKGNIKKSSDQICQKFKIELALIGKKIHM